MDPQPAGAPVTQMAKTGVSLGGKWTAVEETDPMTSLPFTVFSLPGTGETILGFACSNEKFLWAEVVMHDPVYLRKRSEAISGAVSTRRFAAGFSLPGGVLLQNTFLVRRNEEKPHKEYWYVGDDFRTVFLAKGKRSNLVLLGILRQDVCGRSHRHQVRGFFRARRYC